MYCNGLISVAAIVDVVWQAGQYCSQLTDGYLPLKNAAKFSRCNSEEQPLTEANGTASKTVFNNIHH